MLMMQIGTSSPIGAPLAARDQSKFFSTLIDQRPR
jgi:hypothetical protein